MMEIPFRITPKLLTSASVPAIALTGIFEGDNAVAKVVPGNDALYSPMIDSTHRPIAGALRTHLFVRMGSGRLRAALVNSA